MSIFSPNVSEKNVILLINNMKRRDRTNPLLLSSFKASSQVFVLEEYFIIAVLVARNV